MEDRPALLEDFGAFYRAHLDVVLTFCLARVRDRELAADLAAEVFAAALIGRGRYRSDRGTERQWLLGIAANKIADARRRGVAERRAQQRLGMAAIEWSEEDYERVASLADGSAVVRLMEALPIEQQVVIWGHVVDEQTYGQLADAYGVKSATVRKTRQPRLGDAARPGGEGGPMTSGFDQLERELRAAEARLAAQHVTPRGMRSPAGLLRAGTALVSALIAIGVVVAAFTVLHPGNRSTGQISPAGPGKRYRDPEGWSVTYPHGLHLTVAKGTAALQEPQVTLTSFTASRFLQGRLRNGTALIPGQMSFNAPVDGDGRFPADGVAVILQSGQYTVLGADSRFPIALSSFHPRSTTTFLATADSRRADVPQARSRVIVAYSEPITATVLIGSRAPAALKRQLEGVIASLTFRALRPGTPVGTGVLLGPASAYEPGSFTRTRVRFPAHRPEPIYVVHAPGRLTTGHECEVAAPCAPAGAFYAIGGSYNTRRNHAPTCSIQFDAHARAFSCSNLAVRWDRVGRVISRPPGESDIGSNEGLYAKICWNGQLMVTQGFGPQLSRAAVHELWPDWRQPNEPLSR